MINNLESQSKTELIKIIHIQCEETIVMERIIKKLRRFTWDMLTLFSVILTCIIFVTFT